jgi:arsenite-transporting ATPase
MTFFAGKGGVGKTTCASSVALQLAARNPGQQYTIISVDPAHSLREVFAAEPVPPNLTVELIDTKAKWRKFRDSIGREIDEAFDALTPRGMSVAHDSEAMQRLVEIAPPGADELFAIIRLADLGGDETQAAVIVDTAPTGHFLRLLDLPAEAGEWVREFMRLLLRYRELIPAGSLGEELVKASRALKDLDAALRSDRTSIVVVTRPERAVVEETKRLVDDVTARGMHVGGIIANYVTPANECRCDQSLRAQELEVLAEVRPGQIIERRDAPPATLAELATLVRL